MAAVKKIPMRMCLGCNEMKPKKELIRVVRSPEGEISLDTTGKKSGRFVLLSVFVFNIPNIKFLKRMFIRK